jgi:hypothetical protein
MVHGSAEVSGLNETGRCHRIGSASHPSARALGSAASLNVAKTCVPDQILSSTLSSGREAHGTQRRLHAAGRKRADAMFQPHLSRTPAPRTSPVQDGEVGNNRRDETHHDRRPSQRRASRAGASNGPRQPVPGGRSAHSHDQLLGRPRGLLALPPVRQALRLQARVVLRRIARAFASHVLAKGHCSATLR